ncbi:MAG: hypothetical protein ABI685_02225 [Ferruginibacter sp.]
MKKFKIVLTAIVMLLSISSFANEPVKVSSVVKAAFQNDFSKAATVSWEKANDFYFASFTLNDVSVDAAYTEKGELIGTSRRISLDLVPLSVSMAIADRYAGYKVDKSVVELTFEGVTRYYVNVENDSHSLKLKCYSNGDLEVDAKTKK